MSDKDPNGYSFKEIQQHYIETIVKNGGTEGNKEKLNIGYRSSTEVTDDKVFRKEVRVKKID